MTSLKNIVKANIIAESKTILNENSPRVYVGTYKKYSEGDLSGQWLDLEDYSDHDEFMEAASEVHSDESDPEFMFQDIDDFKGLRAFYTESSIDPDYWQFLEETSDWDDEKRDVFSKWVDDGYGDTISDFNDAYMGDYGSMRSYAEQMVDDGVYIPSAYEIYISDTDRRIIAGEEADNLVDESYDDEDIVGEAGSEYIRGYEFFKDNDDEDYDEDEYSSFGEYAEEQTGYESLEDLLDDAKEDARSNIYDRIYNELSDPVQYFVNDHGMYSEEDLLQANFIMVDYDSIASSLEQDTIEINGHILLTNY